MLRHFSGFVDFRLRHYSRSNVRFAICAREHTKKEVRERYQSIQRLVDCNAFFYGFLFTTWKLFFLVHSNCLATLIILKQPLALRKWPYCQYSWLYSLSFFPLWCVRVIYSPRAAAAMGGCRISSRNCVLDFVKQVL